MYQNVFPPKRSVSTLHKERVEQPWERVVMRGSRELAGTSETVNAKGLFTYYRIL